MENNEPLPEVFPEENQLDNKALNNEPSIENDYHNNNGDFAPTDVMGTCYTCNRDTKELFNSTLLDTKHGENQYLNLTKQRTVEVNGMYVENVIRKERQHECSMHITFIHGINIQT